MKKLYGLAICGNCNKKHFGLKKYNRFCSCGYYISYVDYKELIYK
jgi:hypothetical protein